MGANRKENSVEAIPFQVVQGEVHSKALGGLRFYAEPEDVIYLCVQ